MKQLSILGMGLLTSLTMMADNNTTVVTDNVTSSGDSQQVVDLITSIINLIVMIMNSNLSGFELFFACLGGIITIMTILTKILPAPIAEKINFLSKFFIFINNTKAGLSFKKAEPTEVKVEEPKKLESEIVEPKVINSEETKKE